MILIRCSSHLLKFMQMCLKCKALKALKREVLRVKRRQGILGFTHLQTNGVSLVSCQVKLCTLAWLSYHLERRCSFISSLELSTCVFHWKGPLVEPPKVMDVMPTHLIFMENNYLFYAQQPQLWTVSCLKGRVSVKCSVLKSFLVHYSIVLFYYAEAECVPSNFQVPWNFPCFFPRSVLLALAWKTMEKTWKISPDPQNMTLNIGLLFFRAF